MSCQDCFGARAVPDEVQGGYRACPGCVIEATATFIYSATDTEDDTAPTA